MGRSGGGPGAGGGAPGGGGGGASGGGSFRSGPSGRSTGGGSFRGAAGRSANVGGSNMRGAGRGNMGMGGFGGGMPGGFGSPLSGPGGMGGSSRGPSRPPVFMPPIILSGGGGGARRSNMAGSGGGPMGSAGRAGCITAVIIVAVVVILIMGTMFLNTNSADAQVNALDSVAIRESTYNREKLQGTGYKNEVYDELGWFTNPDTVAQGIRGFYDATGVQPVIYLENKPELMGDLEGQQAEAERIFKELGLGSNAFLFVYFDDNGQDGEWTTWTGNDATTVMDDEAVQIFSDYLGRNWFSDKNENDLFIDTFNSTANRIMSKTTNSYDVWKWVWIALAITAAALAIFFIARQRRRHEAERAAETERILKADITDLADDPELLNKYKDDK